MQGKLLVAAIYAVISSAQRGSAVISGLAAMLGWAALLAVAAARGPVATLAAELGGVLSPRTAGVYAVTIAFPGLLAPTAGRRAGAHAEQRISRSLILCSASRARRDFRRRRDPEQQACASRT